MIPCPITNNNAHKLCKTVYNYVILSLHGIYTIIVGLGPTSVIFFHVVTYLI